jgi:hypothetical protein
MKKMGVQELNYFVTNELEKAMNDLIKANYLAMNCDFCDTEYSLDEGVNRIDDLLKTLREEYKKE